MAGRGPAPKTSRSRARDVDTRELVKTDGKLGGFDLPEDALDPGEDWHPMTVRWWEAWRASPQGVRMVTEVDWYFLLDTALMHHTMWAKGKWEFAAEVRLRAAKFGATPEDRLRLKLEVEVPEDVYPVGTPKGGANVTRMDDHRSRWTA
jgi:hypothetical protein